MVIMVIVSGKNTQQRAAIFVEVGLSVYLYIGMLQLHNYVSMLCHDNVIIMLIYTAHT